MTDETSESTDSPLPEFGVDKAPTPEMIVEGRVGNGTYERFTSQLASQIQHERKLAKREAVASRKEAYEEGMKDALGKIAYLEHGIIEIGVKLLERLELGEALTSKELDTLKLAQSAAKEMKDRAMGKAKTTAEVKTHTNILHLIAGLDG